MGRLAAIDPGRRRPYLALLSLADDAHERVAAHLDDGEILTWSVEDAVVGAMQAVARTPSLWEFTLIAVDPNHQREGHGTEMLDAAVDLLGRRGARRVVVGTASAGTGQLGFYQRCGFRVFAVEHDYFDQARGYDGTETENGITIRDMVWLDRLLT